jgi:hypothetical protein
MFSRRRAQVTEPCALRLLMDSNPTETRIRAVAATILFFIFTTQRHNRRGGMSQPSIIISHRGYRRKQEKAKNKVGDFEMT